MKRSRRYILAVGSSSLLLSGCTDVTTDGELVELELELENRAETANTFSFVIETSDGLSEWNQRDVEPNDRETVSMPLPGDGTEERIHAVVNDEVGTGVFRMERTDVKGDYCAKMIVRYTDSRTEIDILTPEDQPDC
ncbi:hypothetical protein [Natronobacterium texcoconense]|uniref:Uncharacterized protein n=1 Tax=Natronobacterium texcoconense TaxID=1095778 RepID=A0A1H1IDE7_NATTX|nr:hypothetical protein [Natronobacterium texcoconense]SDR35722.1 hypothetical protein SAMN04489842_3459 [Natronobacterium texcoconense]